MNVSTDGNFGDASTRDSSKTVRTPESSSVLSSKAAKIGAILTRLNPDSSRSDKLHPEDLTKKVPSPRSALVLPSPRMANRRSSRPICRESKVKVAATSFIN